MTFMLWLSTVSFKFESYLGDFPKVSTGWPDHCCWTSHFAAISFFREFLLKSHLLHAYYLEFDKSGWIVLIKSEILIMTGMIWPVSSDKWKEPKLWRMWEVLGFKRGIRVSLCSSSNSSTPLISLFPKNYFSTYLTHSLLEILPKNAFWS